MAPALDAGIVFLIKPDYLYGTMARMSVPAEKSKTSPWIIGSILILAVASLYGRTIWFDFVGYDDTGYVSGNAMVGAGLNVEGVKRALTTFDECNWHPLTWLSLMLDTTLFGRSPAGYHASNVLLHALNTLLVFLVLRRMTGAIWRAALVAALFAVHPLHVESVAWVSERKDVASAFFFWSTLGFYGWYARTGRKLAYFSALFCLVLGLMAKPMLVTLPFVLLLLDIWPLGRWSPWKDFRKAGGLLLEKTPFFLASFGSVYMTLLAQHRCSGLRSLADISLAGRVGNALVSYLLYISKMFRPADLVPFYPHPGGYAWYWVLGSAAVILGISLLAVAWIRIRPYVALGWFWFLGTLAPVIGLVQVGAQSMADRYTYIPLIGLYIILAWGGAEFAGRRLGRGKALVAVAILAGLSALTWIQVGYWQNGVRLFEHTREVTPDNSMAEYVLANNLSDRGDLEGALVHFKEAVRIDPRFGTAYNNMGNVYNRMGRLDLAMENYRLALRFNNRDDKAHFNLGALLARQGDYRAAAEHFQKAIDINPGFEQAREYLRRARAAAGAGGADSQGDN